MAATRLIEALQAEVATLKGPFGMIAPKFANYDLMALENGPWKAEFERLLKVQEADLKGLYERRQHHHRSDKCQTGNTPYRAPYRRRQQQEVANVKAQRLRSIHIHW